MRGRTGKSEMGEFELWAAHSSSSLLRVGFVRGAGGAIAHRGARAQLLLLRAAIDLDLRNESPAAALPPQNGGE